MAQTFTSDNLNYRINNDGISVTVTGHVDGQNATGLLVLPENVNYQGRSYSVTSIGACAFFGCSGFTGSLTIPNSVVTIGDGNHSSGVDPRGAFEGCTGITGSLTIGNSLTRIGANAFFG